MIVMSTSGFAIALWFAVALPTTSGFMIPEGRMRLVKKPVVNSSDKTVFGQPASQLFAGPFFAFPEKDSEDSHPHDASDGSRRHLVVSIPAAVATAFIMENPQPAGAELINFPLTKNYKFKNTYHFMRAGESKLEEQDIWETNPLFLTNRENALSKKGEEQVHAACRMMNDAKINLGVVKFSLAANAIDTSNIIAQDLLVGRNRLVPEYTYLDQRGIGKWDGMPLKSTQEAVWAMDATEAGKYGLGGGLPPPNDDGTAHEMLGHQVTRLRQLLSLLETQLSGDDILLIFPDGTGPALLSCLMADIPLNRVHELSFGPGETRLNVHYDTVRQHLAATPADKAEAYTAAISRGKKHLKVLRDTKLEDLVTVEDRLYAEEQMKEQKRVDALKKAKLERIEAEKKNQEKRLALIEAEKMERKKQIEAKHAEKEKRLKEQIESERAKRDANSVSGSSVEGGIAASALLLTLGIGSGFNQKDESAPADSIASDNRQEDTKDKAPSIKFSTEQQKASTEDQQDDTKNDLLPIESNAAQAVSTGSNNVSDQQEDTKDSSPGIKFNKKLGVSTGNATAVEDQQQPTQSISFPPSEIHSDELQAMEDKIESAPFSIPEFSAPTEEADSTPAGSSELAMDEEEYRIHNAEKFMQEYLDQDDGGDAWLQVLGEIATEEDEDEMDALVLENFDDNSVEILKEEIFKGIHSPEQEDDKVPGPMKNVDPERSLH